MDIPPLQPVALMPVPRNEGYFLARVIDTETTDADPETSEVIEVGWVDVWFPVNGGKPFMSKPFKTLVKPSKPITIEAMAVHHITEAEAATGIPQDELQRLVLRDQPNCYVAHNSKFEQALLNTEGAPWICTYKASLRVYPDSPRHTNQVLRYQLGIELDPELAQPPHRAAPDAYVTAFILIRLAETVSLEQMIEWTAEPAKFPRMPLGKHKGAEWNEVPESYLRWMIQEGKFDDDILANVRREQDRRRAIVSMAPAPEEPPVPNIFNHEDACAPV